MDEHGLEALVTPPKVPYRITHLPSKSNPRAVDAPTKETIEDLSKWPGQGLKFKVEEPVVDVTILAPMDYAGNIMELIKRKRGIGMESRPIDEITWIFTATVSKQIIDKISNSSCTRTELINLTGKITNRCHGVRL